MSYEELVKKIESAINCIDNRIVALNKKIHLITNTIKARPKDTTIKYQYELERDNYSILKTNNDIVKAELFKKRCRYYLEYLKYNKSKDILNIKRNEYNFIKTIQDEVIFYFDSKENELKQRAMIEKIVGKEITSYDMIKDLHKDREKKYNMFLKKEFYLDPDKIYTFSYLNYDINEVTKMIYTPKGKKKAS
jgi:hypothetical protein